VDPSSSFRTQRVLFSFVPICTLTRCPPGRVSFSTERSSSSVSFVHSYALARCPPGRALRILSDSVSSELTAEFLPQMHPCIRSMPTWQSSTERPQRFCLLSNCTPCTVLNAHLAELYRTPQMILSLLNSQQSSSNCTTVPVLNAHLAELYRIHSRILSATVSLIHSLTSKVFNNLEVFFL
jgi:hypothetical protein